ncbi:hypothetical protein J6590_026640 [Homalodisca vitripennis]|nr:hypothetical protein J6590_026640 [Homalodisca vitripennis]
MPLVKDQPEDTGNKFLVTSLTWHSITHILYKANTNKPLSKRDFLCSIVDELCLQPGPAPRQPPELGAGGDVLEPPHGLVLLADRNNHLCAVCTEKKSKKGDKLLVSSL